MWCKAPLNSYNTVDGRDPAPVDRWFFPFFTKFYTSQVVQDFFHQQYEIVDSAHMLSSLSRIPGLKSQSDDWRTTIVTTTTRWATFRGPRLSGGSWTGLLFFFRDGNSSTSLSLSLFLWIHYMYYIIISASVNIWTNLSRWIESGFVLVSLPVPSSVVWKTLDLDR